MATASLPQQRASGLRPKYVVFGFVALMFGYVLVHNESFLIHPKDPIWEHYRQIKWYLLPHGILGACALLLGPMQFSDRLRQRFTKLHRVIGRFYVGGVFFAAPLGAAMQFYEERMGTPRSFSVATIIDAGLWVITTAIALFFILRGKTQLHRQWMTRSFACALIFLEARVVLGVFGLEKFGPWVIETTVWGCMACSILIADIVLQWQDFASKRRAPARVAAAVPVVSPAASD